VVFRRANQADKIFKEFFSRAGKIARSFGLDKKYSHPDVRPIRLAGKAYQFFYAPFSGNYQEHSDVCLVNFCFDDFYFLGDYSVIGFV